MNQKTNTTVGELPHSEVKVSNSTPLEEATHRKILELLTNTK